MPSLMFALVIVKLLDLIANELESGSAEGICFSKPFFRYFCHPTWQDHSSCYFMRYDRPYCFGPDRNVQNTLLADYKVVNYQ